MRRRPGERQVQHRQRAQDEAGEERRAAARPIREEASHGPGDERPRAVDGHHQAGLLDGEVALAGEVEREQRHHDD